jgi:hypothetical protein
MQVQYRGEWMIRQCCNAACGLGALRVRRDPCHADSWWISLLQGRVTWREAATEPFCPVCGGDLQSAKGVGWTDNASNEPRVA